jgi:hypothetical protein
MTNLLKIMAGVVIAGALPFVTIHAQEPALPEQALQRVRTYFEARMSSRYMEQNCHSTTYPGWDGLPLQECTYGVKGSNDPVKKTAKVIMLNATPDQLARWVVSTCLEVTGSAATRCTKMVSRHIHEQSGAQFPIAGIVFEDILPADGRMEVYAFRNGVTVRVPGVTHRGTQQPTADEIQKSLNADPTTAFKFARIQGTTREDYQANGGTRDVAALAWLDVSRDLYKAAWDHNRNELLVAWARAYADNLASAPSTSSNSVMTNHAAVGEFETPWADEQTAIVIDPFQGNTINFDKMAEDQRVAGIIHRATIGDRKDTKYAERKAKAIARGYKWGSYHLGKPGDPIVQADFYLATVGNTPDEVLALDIESLNAATDMTLANARRFITRIREKTGRFPMLYANQAVVKEISSQFGRDDVFSKTPLWYARFKSSVTDFPRDTWDTYTLWQFSSELNCKPAHPEQCLYRVPGTLTDMDVNVFNGSVEALRQAWPFKKE